MIDTTITPAIAILAGTELRRIVGAEPAAPFARASRRFGDLVVELVRSHSTWRLYLADLAPVKHARRDLWATAVSAPSVDWMRTQDGCLVWCEWTKPASHWQSMTRQSLTYLFTNLAPHLRKGTMLEVSEATPATIGAELRRIVAADPAARSSTTIRRIGQLDVQLVRRGDLWTLYLADLVPIPHTTRDQWATAVSAPSVEWSQTPDGCSAWCEWREPQP